MTAPAPPSASVPPWSTVRIRVRSDGIELADRLDAVGGLLATLDGVSGVELRDPTTFDGPERAELIAYTTPEERDGVLERAQAFVRELELGPHVELDAATHTDDSWYDGWKSFYQPLRFGPDRFLVRPSWVERVTDDPTCEIVLDPGRAFGTGQHETTHLCLEAFVEAVFGAADRPWRPHRVLDLGCGSGILALAAARLLPDALVTAVDIDPEAVDTARENATHNALEARVDAQVGGVERVPVATHDLIFANIRPAVLIPHAQRIADGLDRASTNPPRLLLSGILETEQAPIRAAYDATGLVEVAPIRQRGEWVALTYGPPR